MIPADFGSGQMSLVVDRKYRGFSLGKLMLQYKCQKFTTGLEGSPTKSKREKIMKIQNIPALNPSFELDKRTRSGQPAEDLELRLGCRLCGSPYFLSAFLISCSGIWRTALGNNYLGLLLLRLRTEAKNTLVDCCGWVVSFIRWQGLARHDGGLWMVIGWWVG